MRDIQLGKYYNRFGINPQYNDYKTLLFRAGDPLQSAELNEMQQAIQLDMTRIATRFLRNGEIISGGEVIITNTFKKTDLSGKDLYDITLKFDEAIAFIDGVFVRVEAGTLIKVEQYIPESSFDVGIELIYSEITNAEDITLLDPAIETRNYGQPGAGRIKAIGKFTDEVDFQQLDNNVFLPIHSIIKAEIYNRDKDNTGDSSANSFNTFRQDVINIVAKYDRNSNGNYLITGYETEYLSKVSNLGPFKFSIADGSANVDGYNFEVDVSQELDLEALIDFELKQSEPVSFSSGNGFYPVRHTPLRKVFRVSGQREIIGQDIQHGSTVGATDQLPDGYQPVSSISKVYQGATIFAQGTDYYLSGDSIVWVGHEPDPSSTYTVNFKYQYTENEGGFTVNPNDSTKRMGDISADLKSIYFHGFAAGTDVQYDYDFVLQRIDAISIDSSGKLVYVKGVPKEDDPRVPDTDKISSLKIAEVLLGGDFDPVVTLSSQRVFKMSDIQLILDSVKQNEYNITRLALAANIADSQPGATLKGQFVDDFNGDKYRDLGLPFSENDAMTIGGNLIMDIDWENENLSPSTVIGIERMTIEMPSTPRVESILEQPHWTKTRQINEYLFKSPPSAKISISPSVYRWVARTSYQTFVKQAQVATLGVNTWATIYKTFGTHRYHTVQAEQITSTTVSRDVLGSSVNRTETVEQARTPSIIPTIPIFISSNDGAFNSNEPVKITVDGKVAATINANSQGTLSANFTLPDGIISGSKEVIASGVVTGVAGTTLFRAEPLSRTVQTNVTEWWRWVVRNVGIQWREADPVAQSFVLNESIALDRVEVVFQTLPITDVSCVICETIAGIPDKNTAITSKTLTPDELGASGTAQPFSFDNKLVLNKGKEYAFIIICKDAVGSVQVAELGAKTLGTNPFWLTGQAYSVGTLYNSSNNSAWTPIQTEDMRFWIYGCDFSEEHEEVFSAYQIDPVKYPNGVTDIMVLANAKVYEGTSIQYKVVLVDRVETAILQKTFYANSYSQFPLGEKYTGRVQVTALFSSNGLYTPVLDPNIQLSLGYSHKSSEYTSIGFPVDRLDDKLIVRLDNYLPYSTSIGVQVKVKNRTTGTESWVNLEKTLSSVPLGNDWVETEYTLDLNDGTPIMHVDQTTSSVKITMTTASDKNRAVISNLRLNTQKI